MNMSYFANNFNSERALRFNFKINNRNFHSIVDSAASCCILRRRHLTTNLCTNINSLQTIEVHGVNGVTKTLGTVRTFAEYNGLMYPITFHVVDKLPPNVIGLVGTNFLKKFGAKINFRTSLMSLRAPRFEENFIIPPRTEVITYVETNLTEEAIILNQEIKPKIYIAGAIVKSEKGRIPMRIMNVKNKAEKIENISPQTKPFKDNDVIEISSTSKYDVARAKGL